MARYFKEEDDKLVKKLNECKIGFNLPMAFVYIVVENGEPYVSAYTNYSEAVKAVKYRHKETLEHQIREISELHSIERILADVNIPENTRGISHLYIEKGINIMIHKLSVR